jgi:adenylate kinase
MAEWVKSSERINLGQRIFAFIGPEGSGKTTMALRLSADSQKPYLTTGDTLRDLAANDHGPYGEACRVMFDAHTYLDGDLLLEIMSQRFSKEDTREGFILDGGFRTLEETIGFDQTLEKAGRCLPVVVIYLDISTEVCFDRLIRGESARKRADDNEGALLCRLDKFYNQLEDRLNIIKEHPGWQIIKIDASSSIETVYAEVCKVLTK